MTSVTIEVLFIDELHFNLIIRAKNHWNHFHCTFQNDSVEISSVMEQMNTSCGISSGGGTCADL